MNQEMQDYLTFRRMVTPAIIQAIFWILVGLVVRSGVIGLAVSIWTMFADSFVSGFLGLVLNIVWLVVLPVVIRIYCELVILFFRINETLTDIKNNTQTRP